MTTTKSTGATRAGTVLATRPLLGWRTVDLLTIAFLGVAFLGRMLAGGILRRCFGTAATAGERQRGHRRAVSGPPAHRRTAVAAGIPLRTQPPA